MPHARNCHPSPTPSNMKAGDVDTATCRHPPYVWTPRLYKSFCSAYGSRVAEALTTSPLPNSYQPRRIPHRTNIFVDFPAHDRLPTLAHSELGSVNFELTKIPETIELSSFYSPMVHARHIPLPTPSMLWSRPTCAPSHPLFSFTPIAVHTGPQAGWIARQSCKSKLPLVPVT